MSAAILERGFTSSDEFQLLYPVLWFLLGLLIGGGGARRKRHQRGRDARPPALEPFLQVVPARAPVRIEPQRTRRPSRSGDRSTDGSSGLALIGGYVIVSLLLAWLYLNGRELALAVAAAPVALTFGLLAGRIVGRIRTTDWWVAIAAWLLLSLAAIWCGLVLLHPPAAPEAYDALFDAFRREGISAADAFDGTVRFISLQAIGALALILGAYLLLYSVSSVVAGEALRRGARPTWWRRLLSRGALSRSRLGAELGLVLLLLTLSFVVGSGYAHSWISSDVSVGARIVAPVASLTGRTLAVDFVIDRASSVRFTVQRRAGTTPIRRWRLALRPGRHRVMRRLAGRRAQRVIVTLTPLNSRGVAGSQRQLIVRDAASKR